MHKSDKERLLQMVQGPLEPREKEVAYDAIAAAERDEPEGNARQLLHDAALELMRDNLDRVITLLSAIDALP